MKRISKSANSGKRFGAALGNNIATFLIILLKTNICYLTSLSICIYIPQIGVF